MKNYIPTIDISPLIKNNFNSTKSLETIKKIDKACVDVGFFQIIGHGIPLNKIIKICSVGEKFFNSPNTNKLKLAPKKWNKFNVNKYRGYFPSDVNGKEGLDIGDLLVGKKYSKTVKNQYIEYLNLNKAFSKSSIDLLKDYYNLIFLYIWNRGKEALKVLSNYQF